jgi:DNA-binding NtrC family response regulator
MSAERRTKSAGPELANVLPPEEVLFGHSEAMKEVRKRATKIARTNVPLLLCGPKGSGKEVLARWIHHHSGVASGEFVKVNCAAIPGTLLESELFGFEKCAFTGAHATKPGLVEHAHNGTLFLDGIADLDMASQSKLLQFLQDGRFSRIGDELERSVDARLICATDKDLDEEVVQGRFRADLYYRIDVVCLKLPPLRERREDIPLMAQHLLARCQEQFHMPAEPLSIGMLRYLQCLEWPGNIRELGNGIARHVIMGPEASVRQDLERSMHSLPPPLPDKNEIVPLKKLCKEVIRSGERSIILAALRANRWNRRKAAQELKISYRLLIYKIRAAGLIARDQRNPGVHGMDTTNSAVSSSD